MIIPIKVLPKQEFVQIQILGVPQIFFREKKKESDSWFYRPNKKENLDSTSISI